MMIPIRCFSCGRVVGSDYTKLHRRIAEGEKPQAIMEDLGIERYCCRRMLVGQSDLIDDAAPYA